MEKGKTRKAGNHSLLPGVVAVLMLLLLAIPVNALAQDVKDGTFGVRLSGGASWPVGCVMENVASSNANMGQPYGSAGIFYNLSPAFRAGLEYSFTKMVREQRFSQLQTVAGVEGGVAYRKLISYYNGVALTAEYNFVELISSGSKLSLYAGAGFGCLFDGTADYTFSVINKTEDAKQTFGIGSHTEFSHSKDLYIPITLSLEYAFLPEVAVTAGCEYRIIPARGQFAPKGMAVAKLGLVFNIGGRMLQ